jgi:hypothetical protein
VDTARGEEVAHVGAQLVPKAHRLRARQRRWAAAGLELARSHFDADEKLLDLVA